MWGSCKLKDGFTQKSKSLIMNEWMNEWLEIQV